MSLKRAVAVVVVAGALSMPTVGIAHAQTRVAPVPTSVGAAHGILDDLLSGLFGSDCKLGLLGSLAENLFGDHRVTITAQRLCS